MEETVNKYLGLHLYTSRRNTLNGNGGDARGRRIPKNM